MTSTSRALWGRRSNRLLVALLSSLLVIVTSCGGGGVDPAAAEQVCTPDLSIGTPCVPAEDSFIHEAFEGRTTADQANELMTDERYRFGGSLACLARASDSVFCLMLVDGAAIVYPVEMPGGREVRFSGGDLAESVSLDLSEGIPLRIRYEGASIQAGVMNGDEELYFLNTLVSGEDEDEGSDSEVDDAADSDADDGSDADADEGSEDSDE